MSQWEVDKLRETNRKLHRRLQRLEGIEAKQLNFDRWRQNVHNYYTETLKHRVDAMVRIDKLWCDRYDEAVQQLIRGGVPDRIADEPNTATRRLDELIRRALSQRDEALHQAEVWKNRATDRRLDSVNGLGGDLQTLRSELDDAIQWGQNLKLALEVILTIARTPPQRFGDKTIVQVGEEALAKAKT